VKLRAMEPEDWAEVADLIYVSLNYWYAQYGKPPIFRGGPSATRAFCEVYEKLDPGHCLVAESEHGRLMGSCFYRSRETHCSLGIMNVHPVYWNMGVGKALLDFIVDFAEREGKPLRLVSSAMNLESFSLYTRGGFVPSIAYQDLYLQVPAEGLAAVPGSERVRPATPADIEAMRDVELAVSGISRVKDYRYFVENAEGFWHVSVFEGDGGLDGWLVSCGHPGLNMIGPGLARTDEPSALMRSRKALSARLNCPVSPVSCGSSPSVHLPSISTPMIHPFQSPISGM